MWMIIFVDFKEGTEHSAAMFVEEGFSSDVPSNRKVAFSVTRTTEEIKGN